MLLLWDGANAHSSTVLKTIKKQKGFTLLSEANIFGVYTDPPFCFLSYCFLGWFFVLFCFVFVLVLPINIYHSLKQLDSDAWERPWTIRQISTSKSTCTTQSCSQWGGFSMIQHREHLTHGPNCPGCYTNVSVHATAIPPSVFFQTWASQTHCKSKIRITKGPVLSSFSGKKLETQLCPKATYPVQSIPRPQSNDNKKLQLKQQASLKTNTILCPSSPLCYQQKPFTATIHADIKC